jgi:hypothetical protein
VSGLALLGQNKYKAAAKAFVEVDPGLGHQYGEVRRGVAGGGGGDEWVG